MATQINHNTTENAIATKALTILPVEQQQQATDESINFHAVPHARRLVMVSGWLRRSKRQAAPAQNVREQEEARRRKLEIERHWHTLDACLSRILRCVDDGFVDLEALDEIGRDAVAMRNSVSFLRKEVGAR